MTVFVIVAALLTLATVALVAGSLARAPRAARAGADEINAAVYRDQLAELDAQLAEGTLVAARHAEAREAIRRRMAQDLRPSAARNALPQRGAALAVALAIAAGAAGMYVWRGTPAALAPQAAAPAARDAAHGLQSEQILGMVERLAARLRENPDDLNGWVMLARSQSALGRFDEASRAYREASQRAPRDAALLADYADVLAMSRGRSFEGEPDRLIARALEIDSGHVKSLALAGSSAFARKDYGRAIELWGRIREQVPADSQMARSIEASIVQARALAVGAPPAAAVAPSAGGAGTLSGLVKLAPALAARVDSGDTLFVYARAISGSPRPVAILRTSVSRWPVEFSLDDTSAMSSGGRLHGEVALEARVSKSGGAAPAPGDLRGILTPVRVGASGVVVEIASVVE